MTAPDRFVAGAIDLGEVKARAEAAARARSHASPSGPAGVAPVVDGTLETAESAIVERSFQVPVVVQIGTSRSPESEAMRAEFTRLAQMANLAWVFVHIDADEQAQLAQMLGTKALPTVLAMAGGQPITSFEGAQPAEALAQWTAAVVGACDGKLEGIADAGGSAPAGDPRIVQAEDLIAEARYDEAVAALEAILASEPANSEAKRTLDQARLAHRLASAEVDDPIAAADANPTDREAVFAAADALIAAGTPEQAFDRLIRLLTVSVGDDKAAVRERLVELFELFDATDPVVISARGRMASALF